MRLQNDNIWLTLFFALFICACGPVQSTQQIGEAEDLVQQARKADAATKAPYQYYRAKQFLYKAKEAWSYSNYEISIEYATSAARDAEEALLKVKEDPWPGHPVESGSY
jgi:hypothetical protein